MRLKSIEIERFKRLEKVEFDVSDVNILVGGNNSGKSTIIQAVHFSFTLFQSLTISGKWPAKTKKSSTISPEELIYIPSDDPYSLGYGGRLLEDEEQSIRLAFSFEDGERASISIRKGRITNILVSPDNVDYARNLSSLDAPYSVFSPGLAGVSRTENHVSDGVLLRALARGDANIVVRNILYRLKGREAEWRRFEEDLSRIFPSVTIGVYFDEKIDQFIQVRLEGGQNSIPLDLAGTGLLQAIQILAYLHLFAPKMIILDEPDSHLHPNNQRLLCALLSTIARERGIQVLITTHSRHVLDALYGSANFLWIQDGSVKKAGQEDQIDLLLELGALDIKEKISAAAYDVVFLTEDQITGNLEKLLENSGFGSERTAILPYNGVTSIHLLKPLIRQISELSKAHVFVHRDRDYLSAQEIEDWKKAIRALGAEPFVTSEIDVEGYFCSIETMSARLAGQPDLDADKLHAEVLDGEAAEAIRSYVNGRVDHARKSGTIGKLDMGALAVEANEKIHADLGAHMKGKRKLSKYRKLLQDQYGLRLDALNAPGRPTDGELIAAAAKYLPNRKKAQ